MKIETDLTPLDPQRIARAAANQESVKPNNPQPTSDVQLSEAARDFGKAVKLLQAEEAVRDDAVARGQAALEHWSPPSDGEIDQIFDHLRDS